MCRAAPARAFRLKPEALAVKVAGRHTASGRQECQARRDWFLCGEGNSVHQTTTRLPGRVLNRRIRRKATQVCLVDVRGASRTILTALACEPSQETLSGGEKPSGSARIAERVPWLHIAHDDIVQLCWTRRPSIFGLPPARQPRAAAGKSSSGCATSAHTRDRGRDMDEDAIRISRLQVDRTQRPGNARPIHGGTDVRSQEGQRASPISWRNKHSLTGR